MLPLGAEPRCNRRRGRHPPRRPPREGDGAPGAARQPGPNARRAPGDRADHREHAPRGQCTRGEDLRPQDADACGMVVKPRERRAVCLKRTGSSTPSARASRPTSGRIMSCHGTDPRTESRTTHAAVASLTGHNPRKPPTSACQSAGAWAWARWTRAARRARPGSASLRTRNGVSAMGWGTAGPPTRCRWKSATAASAASTARKSSRRGRGASRAIRAIASRSSAVTARVL